MKKKKCRRLRFLPPVLPIDNKTTTKIEQIDKTRNGFGKYATRDPLIRTGRTTKPFGTAAVLRH